MPNTTDYEFGDVVLVPFPFTDQTTSKKRRAVVVNSTENDRTVLKEALKIVLGDGV